MVEPDFQQLRRERMAGARDAVALMLAWIRDDDEGQQVLADGWQRDATALIAGLLNVSTVLAQAFCDTVDRDCEEYLEHLTIKFAEGIDLV